MAYKLSPSSLNLLKDCNFVKLITYSDKTKDNIYACKDSVKSVANCVFVKGIAYKDGTKENIFACPAPITS